MNKVKLVTKGLIHATLTALYVLVVAIFMFYGDQVFGQVKSFIAPLAFLLLFVLSAAVVGALILGRPVLMYLDNQKKEALQFFGYTLFWLFVYTVLVLLILLFI